LVIVLNSPSAALAEAAEQSKCCPYALLHLTGFEILHLSSVKKVNNIITESIISVQPKDVFTLRDL